VPGIMRQMVRDSAAAAPQWRIAIASIFQINQAFSRIYSVAASAAIVLWSVSSLRNGGLSRFAAIYGCVVAPLVAILVIIGHLRMNVHALPRLYSVRRSGSWLRSGDVPQRNYRPSSADSLSMVWSGQILKRSRSSAGPGLEQADN